MASRMKEDERNEKIIRGLLKLPANRRCINCNNLGPQYVCTNFWTFICTNCSGLHREFCHRVKSISMAKFTTQEVNALQEGGNERAKEIYFKEWDPQRHSFPDSSNIDRLRDFIKHVYVDRRFTGERNTDRPPRGKADRDDSTDSRRGDSNRGDPRSPPYDDHYSERLGTGGRNGDRNIRYVYGERSPGYDPGDNKRSPRRFEVVDDRVRDDRYGTGNQIRRFEDRRHPDMASKPEILSPSRPKDLPSPPMVRPVRDILGDDAPQLRVGDAPKSNNVRVPDTSAPVQRTSPSSSMGSNDENSAQSKRVNLGSLIDFTTDPEPPVAMAPQPSVPQQTNLSPSNGGDWASFDNVGQQPAPQTTAPQIAPQTAANSGTLESALAQLSTPGPAPTTHMPTLPLSGVDASSKINDGGKWPAAQQHQSHQTSLFSANFSQSANPHFNAPVAGGQPWGSSVVPNIQGPVPNLGGHSAQVASKPPQVTSAEVSLQPPSVEAKHTGRKELPADLFAALYPSAPVPVPGWQRGPHPGMAYGMQYPMVMLQAMPTYSHQSKSTNPFDVGSEPHLAHASTFPSMASMQGALPHVPGSSPLARTYSLGNPSPQWGGPQQSFSPLARTSSLGNPSSQWGPSQQSFSPAMSQGQYMAQQVPGNMPQMLHNNMVMTGHQGTGGSGSPAAALGNLGMDQLPTSRYSLPSTPNSFGSAGGNPFG